MGTETRVMSLQAKEPQGWPESPPEDGERPGVDGTSWTQEEPALIAP